MNDKWEKSEAREIKKSFQTGYKARVGNQTPSVWLQKFTSFLLHPADKIKLLLPHTSKRWVSSASSKGLRASPKFNSPGVSRESPSTPSPPSPPLPPRPWGWPCSVTVGDTIWKRMTAKAEGPEKPAAPGALWGSPLQSQDAEHPGLHPICSPMTAQSAPRWPPPSGPLCSLRSLHWCPLRTSFPAHRSSGLLWCHLTLTLAPGEPQASESLIPGRSQNHEH